MKKDYVIIKKKLDRSQNKLKVYDSELQMTRQQVS